MPRVILPGSRVVEVPTSGRQSVRAQEVYSSIPTGYSLLRRQQDGSLRQVKPQDEVQADEAVYGQPRNEAGWGSRHSNAKLILSDAEYLRQRGFGVQVAKDASSVVVNKVTLPGPGWTDGEGKSINETAFFFPLPPNFPAAIPGVGLAEPSFAIHTPAMQFRGRPLRHLYECDHTKKGWRWLCFQQLAWDPSVPRPLVALLEICEGSLADRAEQTYRG